jgi:hypothetical protein
MTYIKIPIPKDVVLDPGYLFEYKNIKINIENLDGNEKKLINTTNLFTTEDKYISTFIISRNDIDLKSSFGNIEIDKFSFLLTLLLNRSMFYKTSTDLEFWIEDHYSKFPPIHSSNIKQKSQLNIEEISSLFTILLSMDEVKNKKIGILILLLTHLSQPLTNTLSLLSSSRAVFNALT